MSSDSNDFFLDHERRLLHCSVTSLRSDAGRVEINEERERTGEEMKKIADSLTTCCCCHAGNHDNCRSQKPGRTKCTNAECPSRSARPRSKFGDSWNDSSRRNDQSLSMLGECQLLDRKNRARYFRDNFSSFLHITRLKLTRLPNTLHFACFLLVNLFCKRWHHAKIAPALILSLVVFLTFVDSAAGAQNENKPSSHQTWTIDEIDSIPISASEMSKRFQFPDFIIPANRLFQFDLPRNAFSELLNIHHYQVSQSTHLHYDLKLPMNSLKFSIGFSNNNFLSNIRFILQHRQCSDLQYFLEEHYCVL